MNQMVFFTVGEDECRAWPIPKGASAPQGAGCIHTDLLAAGLIGVAALAEPKDSPTTDPEKTKPGTAPLTYVLALPGVDLGAWGWLPGCGLGLFGAWLAMCADLLVRGAFFFARFLSGAWQRARV